MGEFIRYQSIVPNRHGRFPGVFALVNGLATDALLSSEDASWVRSSNDRANAAYADPTTVVAGCYDPVVNPGARSWFRSSAKDLIDLTREYLDLLDRYRVRWVELQTNTPGRITYEDRVHVVAVPHTYPDDWPFDRRRPSTPRDAIVCGSRLTLRRATRYGFRSRRARGSGCNPRMSHARPTTLRSRAV